MNSWKKVLGMVLVIMLCFSGQSFAASASVSKITIMKENTSEIAIKGMGIFTAQQTSDLGYIGIGTVNMEGVYLFKATKTGKLEWKLPYRIDLVSFEIKETPQHDFLIASGAYDDNGHLDCTLLKISKKGKQLWSHSIAGMNDDIYTSTTPTADGGSVTVGSSTSNDDILATIRGEDTSTAKMGILVKQSRDGKVVWATGKLEKDKEVEFLSVVENEDGNLTVLAHTTTGLEETYALIQYDDKGNLRNEIPIKNQQGKVYLASDGGYLVLGLLPSVEGGAPILLKYSNSGTLLWEHKWGSKLQKYLTNLLVLPDGSIVVSGEMSDGDSSVLPIFSTLSKDGKILGEKIFYNTKHTRLLGIGMDQNGKPTVLTRSMYGNGMQVISFEAMGSTAVEIGQNEVYSVYTTISPTNATELSLKWVSSNVKVATVDSAGNVTGLATGSTTITVSNEANNVQATLKVKVTNPIKGLAIEAGNLMLNPGESEQLKAVATPVDADKAELTWSSSNPKVLTVSKSGKVTAKKEGLATVTVSTKDGKYASSIGIYVHTAVKSIKLNAEQLTLNVNDKYALHAQLAPKQVHTYALEFVSSDPKIAKIVAGKIVAVKPGKVTITAYVLDKANAVKLYYTDEDGNESYGGTQLMLGRGSAKATCTVTVVK